MWGLTFVAVLLLVRSSLQQNDCTNRRLFDDSTQVSGLAVQCVQEQVPDNCINGNPQYYCYQIRVDGTSYLTTATDQSALCEALILAGSNLVEARARDSTTRRGNITFLTDGSWSGDISTTGYLEDLACEVDDFGSGTTTDEPTDTTTIDTTTVDTTTVDTTTVDTTTVDTTTVDTTTDTDTTTTDSGTTTSPGSPPELPGYQVTQDGTFQSDDGSDFEAGCRTAYSNEFNDQAFDMVSILNDEIGNSLCADAVGGSDFDAILSSTSLSFNGAQGTSFTSFTLIVRSGSTTEAIINACAVEIAVFLEDHANWGRPVVPGEPGCPDMDFVPEKFNTSGYNWLCESVVQEGNNGALLRKLRYSFRLRGMLVADDDLTAGCTNQYLTQLRDSTARQISATNSLIGDELCQGQDAVIGQGSINLLADGDTATSFQTFVLNSDEDMTFDDIYACAEEVSAYLEDHSNWDQPILPPVTGCPSLVFEPDEFSVDSQYWQC